MNRCIMAVYIQGVHVHDNNINKQDGNLKLASTPAASCIFYRGMIFNSISIVLGYPGMALNSSVVIQGRMIKLLLWPCLRSGHAYAV